MKSPFIFHLRLGNRKTRDKEAGYFENVLLFAFVIRMKMKWAERITGQKTRKVELKLSK
jgi:hypothetical protein